MLIYDAHEVISRILAKSLHRLNSISTYIFQGLLKSGMDRQRQNESNIELFLQQRERRAYTMAFVSVRHREDALDIVQDSMLKFVAKYAGKSPSEWAPLFYRVMQNQIKDWQRRSFVRNKWRVWFNSSAEDSAQTLEEMQDHTAKDPLQSFAQNTAMQTLVDALALLSKRQQQVFLLRAWEGMDVKDTAKVMGLSEGSIKTHYSRAVHALRTHLEGHWP